MTRDPLASISTRATPQSQQADPRQVANNAGGFTFTLDPFAQLRRFLVLGVAGGTYYVKPAELALENAQVVLSLTMTPATHRQLVDTIVEVSEEGSAPRQQPALFALAVAASNGEAEGRRYALDQLARVARTGTHLFQFTVYVEQFRGHGRQLNRALGEWYLGKSVEDLAYQVVKYRRRLDWTHRDVLRKAKPRRPPNTYWRGELFDWIVGRPTDLGVGFGHELLPSDSPLRLVEGFERAQRTTDPRVAAQLVREYRLSWEMLPDAVINATQVWEALLETGVPQTALLRQLPRLTRLGMLTSLSPWTPVVVNQLADVERLRRARVHPLSVLVALRTYASGRSDRGTSTWLPSRPIVDGLDAAFYAAFGAVQPTGRRLLLALDVSQSMAGSRIVDTPLTARDASAALALVTAATESSYEVVGFTSGSGRSGHRAISRRDAALTPLAISSRQRLDDALRTVSNLPFGGTDCALPMLYALERNLEVDAFVIYTDNETWAGTIHPHEALRRYRDRTGIPAKLIVVGMTSTGFTIADPTDAGSLDVVGFDTGTPQLISSFVRGEV
jgi:60 kDa SS-A/Ro ribonucleoprotein